MQTPEFDPSISKYLAGVVGAALSMKFIQGSLTERLFMALGGSALSYWATPPIAAWVGIPNAEGLAGFLIGLFGMAIIAKVYEAIRAADASKMLADAWGALTKRIGG